MAHRKEYPKDRQESLTLGNAQYSLSVKLMTEKIRREPSEEHLFTRYSTLQQYHKIENAILERPGFLL
jgi:hypothetical protein